jgi:hypothetical protein
VDLAQLIPLLVSLLGAFGVATVIGQWFASGKDRRDSRAEVLRALSEVEDARGLNTQAGPDLEMAIRKLETAALVARVPRVAVLRYTWLARAANYYLSDQLELRGEPEYVGLELSIADAVLRAARIVAHAAWATPATRWLWLRPSIHYLDVDVLGIDDAQFQERLKHAKRFVR